MIRPWCIGPEVTQDGAQVPRYQGVASQVNRRVWERPVPDAPALGRPDGHEVVQ